MGRFTAGQVAETMLPPHSISTKIQRKNYEPGEFTDKKDRTYEETIRVVEEFPWEEQRDKLQVSLTNPSITLEGSENDFLKLALFYSGKFVLHYFDRQHHLYTKSLATYSESYPYLEKFYAEEPFDTTDFKLETTWMQHNKVHFSDKDFHYAVTAERIRYYLLGTSGMNFLFTIFMTVFFISKQFFPPVFVFLILPIFFLAGGGINILFFFNYYQCAKGKMLIMTRGNEQFSFGAVDAPAKFNKKEIIRVKVYGKSGYRSATAPFSWVQIDLKDGQSLAIPNLLINETDLTYKLFEYPAETVRTGWPFIPSSFFSAPS